ncbi:MAG: heavy metal translocating P-type ATPase [Betaproteobacteria bacterium HGW-Betaproteobacteria-2]|nr:MAG: heavy metal translocating P-type ATPase [Betaproteobacteria bacterium HGW-Betaproteobacteria-2]
MTFKNASSSYRSAANAATDNASHAVLDDPIEWPTFSRQDTADSSLWDSHLVIEGMHCAACANTVERALKSVPGVLQAEVNGVTGRAAIKWSASQTRPSDWVTAVNRAGYGAMPASDADALASRKKVQRLALWRWLVAGFCMMQVMMYAAPVYVAEPGDMTPDILHLLRWASWVLTLPVMLFSCGPFFENAWRDIRHQQISMDLPVSLGIIIMFIVSSIATFWPQGWWAEEVYFDSITMFVFFLLTGRWLETRLRNKTAGALDDLMRRLPESVERQMSDGSFERISSRRIRQGDVLRILPGEAFPADGELIEGETQADEALLTGESRPVKKTLHSELIAGSHNLSSAILMRVSKVGQDTRYAQIVTLMEKAATDKPRLAILADRIARPFLLLVLLAALGAVVYWWPTDPARGLMAAVAVLVVTCPCALSLATPAAMLASAGALAKRGVLTRRLQALEMMAGIDTVGFDKTGTLTNDRMKVSSIQVRNGWSADEALQLAAAIAQHSLHPVSRALVDSCPHARQTVDKVQEISGQGLMAETLHGMVRLGSARFCEVDFPDQANMQVQLADSRGWLASFELDEDIREDAAASIAQLRDAGMAVEILSGDRRAAVQRVAKSVGIEQIAADSTPQDKLMHIQHLQQAGHRVAMVGDGLNDGPVLAGAQVSIALGQAAPLAQSQSDFVILGARLQTVSLLLLHARRTMFVVRQNLLWAAVYNAVCIPLAVTGWINAWIAGLGMALSSLLVIMNAARLAKIRR